VDSDARHGEVCERPITVRPLDAADHEWVLHVVRGWGADFVVSRGRAHYPEGLPGYCALGQGGDRLGLASYRVSGSGCELVLLEALVRRKGVGTFLVEAVADEARRSGCRRLWLVTRNDNLAAQRFYQRRGFRIAAVHRDAVDAARVIKPSIPATGLYGIPIHDEIEFELLL
jgi:ribosomal protein S18 acetylase RimI-like enzyme